MFAVVFGAVLLLATLAAIRSFVGANPAAMASALHTGGAIVLAIVAIAALAFGRLFIGLSAVLLVWALYSSRGLWRAR